MALRGTGIKAEQLLSPLTVIETGAIRCIGLNYKDHAVSYGYRHLDLSC
jgi:hypothetical protein